ncbi:hypothetical protein PLICRDRAFT_55645 [Plicaturopsis crispa FD-325 SS-3]|nr:hypothetical protein PLICRDRAFT_55645 [Plicaturopsis crispa FD-325 SS-3]
MRLKKPGPPLWRVPQPTPESLAHRARIATIISSLRDTRARVPFWKLAAHNVPTRWSLYRGLMRNAPNDIVKVQVRKRFKNNIYLTSDRSARSELLAAHRMLDSFIGAQGGDERLQALLKRYTSLLIAKQTNEKMLRIIKATMKSTARELKKDQYKPRPKVIMTGGYFRASLFNKPLARVKPQPQSLTMMIAKRRIRRQWRQERNEEIGEWRDMLRHEESFERALGALPPARKKPFQPAFDSDNRREWDAPLFEEKQQIIQTFVEEQARLNAPFPPELLEKVKAARTAKIKNKTRENKRERRGEITNRTIWRRNKGPPAHVLQHMSPKQKEMDRVVRSTSEVGYVGMIKRQLGFKLRDPDAWKVEIGKDENRRRLDEEAHALREENIRRRTESDSN